MRMQQTSSPSFRSYVEDLKSSTNCCRSASLLVPASDANVILQTLRCKSWMCQAVLTRPWRKKATTCVSKRGLQDPADKESQEDSWYYQCLPSEEELKFLRDKYQISYMSSTSTDSLQTQVVKYHMQSKSLLVPLTSDATELIVQAWFDDSFSTNNKEGLKLVCDWLQFTGIMIVHNYDGNQTVSLFKEIDCFPESVTTHESSAQFMFVDLFAGIGGFRIGMEHLGGKCIGCCEIDAYARETYHNNFHSGKSNEEFFVNDIARLDLLPDTVDVICGGFPCQSFSTMASFPSSSTSDGTSHDHRQGGLLTPAKGKLFFHLLRVLRKAKPKMFVFENVKGLMTLEKGSHFERILCLLEESGYRVSHGIVDAAWVLPQRRERVYFVGIRRDLFDCEEDETNYEAFTPQELKEKYRIYDNDLDMSVNKYMRLLDRLEPKQNKDTVTQHRTALSKSRIGDIFDADDKIPSHCFLTGHQWKKIQSQTYLQLHNDGAGQLITEDEPCSQTLVSSYRQSYLLHSQFIVPRDSLYLRRQEEALKSAAVAKGCTASSSDGEDESTNINEKLPRFFSPRECCRLQGFPESFQIPCSVGSKSNNNKQKMQRESQFYRQIGNAVSPPCVAAVAKKAVDRLFSKCVSSDSSSRTVPDLDCPVKNLLLKSCLHPDKVVAPIHSKKCTSLLNPY